ncbi:MAG: FG-GAP-like repeat-containing protein, partial [Verrucomicrobiales bacterium]|nr:FG-GAP-like repeat-containing protein [Verrucomicrobiales bacterium]
MAFEEVGEAWGLGWEGVSFGAATADLDGDGDEDVVVSNFGAPVGVYRNTSVEGNLVKVKLRGALSNASGIGARVRVKTRSHGEQVRELALGRGWLSSSEPVVHIGTGADEVVSEMVVEWPSGRVQRFSDLEVNRLYTVSEPAERVEARGVGDVEQGGGSWFVASDALAGAVPKENEFDDFAVQPLLPNRLSAEGPAMAWGDVDGDGDRDLYLGGAVGTGGQLWTNGASGGFSRHEVAAFEADRYAEDGGAVFFDFDGDGDLDLFVSSGGYELPVGDVLLSDRLYVNDGVGGFARVGQEVCPGGRSAGGAVAAGDYDRDGDMDLFVGGRLVPGRYPESGTNRLLVNEGGKLVERTPGVLRQTGLVTAAMWSDSDGDGWEDLLVAHEWGAVRVFRNRDKRLVDETGVAGLEGLLGWWYAIAESDVDGDGDRDYVVGNVGLNTKYRATVENPELL